MRLVLLIAVTTALMAATWRHPTPAVESVRAQELRGTIEDMQHDYQELQRRFDALRSRTSA
jgi:hypothetical protein